MRLEAERTGTTPESVAAPPYPRPDTAVTPDRGQETLRQSQALLDAIFESAPVGLGFWDRDLRYFRVNRQLARINGLDPDAHIGKTPKELLPGLEGVDDLLSLWRKIVDGESAACTTEVTGATPAEPNGRRHWRGHFFPVRVDDSVVGIGGVVEDVTEQRRAEQEVQANLRRFRGFAEHLDDIVWLVDLNRQQAIYVNPAFRRVWQRPEQDLYDDFAVWRCAIHPDDREHVVDTFESSARRRYDVEYRITRPDGSERLIRERAFPVDDLDRGLVGGIAEDITERRAAALALLKQERRYERMFNLTGASVWQLDYTEVRDRLLALKAAGVTELRTHLRGHPEEMKRLVAAIRVISVNKATLDLFNVRDVKTFAEWVPELYDEETASGYLQLFDAIWHGRTRIQYDSASRTLDGKYLYLAVNATISSAEEAPFEVLISATNITDLNRTQVDLQEADRRKDQFLTVLAHELLSPLAAIHSAAELLRTPLLGTEQGHQIGDVLCRQTDQLTRLLHDLLDVSRVGQGKLVLDASPVDLRSVVFQAVEVHREQANRKRQVLEVDAPAEPVVVHGDRARLVQCVSNLVHNAVKYTQAEGQVVVRVARDGDNAGVAVRDNGRGIPPGRLRDVFDMFSQVGCRPDQSGGGLGIGLNVVKRLVEMHGGTVDVHSEGAGRGSEFSIRLPCVMTPTVPDALLAPAAPVSRSVLVVDDNADVAEMMALLLGSLGCSVRTALDGEAAIKAAEQDPPDAVLLDIGLPGMDGYEVAAALRSKGYLGRLIALTGFGRSEDRQSALAAGFDHHVVKPGDVNVLRELLR